MSFEVRDKDLLGRVGRLETKSGRIETPLLLPVVNPTLQLISPQELQESFDCRALITNAYIIRKNFEEEAMKKGIHKFLDFDGVIMTDSGAYQILVYGDVEVSPEEIVQFQEEIDTDIATILDVPTGWDVTDKHAQHTIDETLKRARRLPEIKTRKDIAWVGPVQGGPHFDLVASSAREMAQLPFEVHALGSPTPVMEQYLFDTLVEMIMKAKTNLPVDRPLHLFGAGHPFMFALAVALGCDIFDSAAYAKYARNERYMTEHGTKRLHGLSYFPCSCPACRKKDPENVLELGKVERQRMLAEHNLFLSFSEIKTIRQAIVEGRLWEHLELRAHAHPRLLQAVKALERHSDCIERYSPIRKRSGLFFFSSLGLARPEVVRHRKRLYERYSPPIAEVLVLLPQISMKPFHKSEEYRRSLKEASQRLDINVEDFHVCVYAAPFGMIPIEIDEIYPLSQYEIATPLDLEMIEYTAEQVLEYILTMNCKKVILFQDARNWKGRIATACREACEERRIPLKVVEHET
ncbi:tRNA guanosine(15) transglycosylase TgtA [Candidatus Bathyarchaeota archaeon]|nr:tRNA guanosine(15) transglycosylase TgtA [Candidatus Bathyarchaeota archaeon]NIR16636.1 tRNA guanosine(15) transglycosylase TgtA [Desulfobacterales bacterium]NIU81747.1 tRNA guanosine(15) transglycosylase TgtA [Candidatus Bathyarchaeota archaeon]NIV68379.1 tRNA guanosine(15) transglycosylase TgtA [Candidatus Bathyarchaeota archaeon]NIW16699.1 tRNA guanosine(15) transglycosylase TgtA [Candidatus Bathyarchaeota archaeon]